MVSPHRAPTGCHRASTLRPAPRTTFAACAPTSHAAPVPTLVETALAASAIGEGMPPSARGAAFQAVAGTTPDTGATDGATGPQQPADAARATRRVLLGPLVAIAAIAILAIVALPGAGPVPASGTQPTEQVLALAASASPVARLHGSRRHEPRRPTDGRRHAAPHACRVRLSPPARRDPEAARPGLQADGQGVGAPGLVAAVKLPDGSVWYGTEGVLWPGGPDATADTPVRVGQHHQDVRGRARAARRPRPASWASTRPSTRGCRRSPAADRITVRMLLAHRSGLFDYFQHKDYPKLVFDQPDHAWTTTRSWRWSGPSAFAPGPRLRLLQHQLRAAGAHPGAGHRPAARDAHPRPAAGAPGHG